MNGFNMSTVTNYMLGSTQVINIYYGSNLIWPISTHDYSKDYLTFEALEAGTFTWTDSNNNNSISYSTDNGSTWNTLTSGSSTPTIAADDKVLLKASGLTISNSYGIGKFSSSGRFNVMGNIMSLVYGDNFMNQTTLSDSQFRQLFNPCTNLINAGNLILPATALAQFCYSSMFDTCPSLTTAPELPATTLAESCYSSMFYGCRSLTTAPVLPATTLARFCYDTMFIGCRSLTTAPVLPATTLASGCYYRMFYGCQSLTTASELPATTLASGCYNNMFGHCTSLTTAPVLPVTTLAEGCYRNMFEGCTSLNYIKCLATDISATNCTAYWVDGVAASGTFIKATSMSSWTTGIDGIPTGWNVQNAS